MRRKYNTIIILGTLAAIILLLLISPKEGQVDQIESSPETKVEGTKEQENVPENTPENSSENTLTDDSYPQHKKDINFE